MNHKYYVFVYKSPWQQKPYEKSVRKKNAYPAKNYIYIKTYKLVTNQTGYINIDMFLGCVHIFCC